MRKLHAFSVCSSSLEVAIIIWPRFRCVNSENRVIFSYTKNMPAFKRAIIMTMMVVSAYVFLQIPPVSKYSLQLFAILFILYWYFQRRHQEKLFYVFAESSSLNIFFLNMAFLILIGGSGDLSSPFFVLTFVQLFFVALACENRLAILLALETALFYLGLLVSQHGLNLGQALSMTEISNLLAIPLVTLFYLFGKVQYQRAYYRSLLLDSEKQERLLAEADDRAVASFINNLLDKRLPMLEYLLTFPEENSAALTAEINLLKQDLNVLLKKIESKDQIEVKDQPAEQEAVAVMEAIDEDA